MDIGARLRELRKAKKLSTRELAKITNISQPVISRLENNARAADVNLIESICHALGLTLDEFFTGSNILEQESLPPEGNRFMDINKRIVQLREEKGYSTTKLAKRAGIAQSTLREIEHGNTSPTWDTINKLCGALELSPLALLTEIYSLPPEIHRIIEKVKRLSIRQLNILDAVLDEWKTEEPKQLKPIHPKSKEEELIESVSSERQLRGTKEDLQREMADFEKRLHETKIESRPLRKL